MISHKYKFIFVHVPKTAGTSLRVAMEGMYDELHDPHHSTLFEIKEKLSEMIFQTYFKFCIVRNPWDREVSRYEYIKQDKDHENHMHCLRGFNEYLFKFDDDEFDAVNYNHLKLNDEIAMDYIIKFENFQEDFNTACDKIGISRRKLPHENKTSHKHYTEYYDNETRQIVAENYAKDIEYFGYKFGE